MDLSESKGFFGATERAANSREPVEGLALLHCKAVALAQHPQREDQVVPQGFLLHTSK